MLAQAAEGGIGQSGKRRRMNLRSDARKVTTAPLPVLRHCQRRQHRGGPGATVAQGVHLRGTTKAVAASTTAVQAVTSDHGSTRKKYLWTACRQIFPRSTSVLI